jgi:SAM-dependent methyltransferase
MINSDVETVASFGDEWSRFNQSGMTEQEARKAFEEYFAVFPWAEIPARAEGFDMGCGSGRWARFVSPRVGKLHCIDPSAALDVARCNLAGLDNVEFHKTSVSAPGLEPASQDFGYSLGVLHHVPDTAAGIRSCAELLKPGAPFLLYLYYAFDNRPLWFRILWKVSNAFRKVICRLPAGAKHAVTNAIAVFVYWPLARGSSLLDRLGVDVSTIPLSFYRHHSFYTMRTDSRDRFGTPLEQRFTREQIEAMMLEAGFVGIRFFEGAPYWCVSGIKGGG